VAVLTLGEAEELAVAALCRSRASERNAALVGRALVMAEAEGLASHGLLRLPLYAAQTKAGKIDGYAVPQVSQPRPAVLAIDAKYGFAYPALNEAVQGLPRIAREHGIALAGICRSQHCGVAGHHVRNLAQAGMVALLFANAPAAMAPWGGKKAVFGTDPIAFACPIPDHEPIVVDLSLSKVARGHILSAARKGERIPDDWALDADGKPTTDPETALAGTMVPAGLTGANFAADATSFLDAEGPPPATGQLMIAIDATVFGAEPTHFARMARIIEDQKGARLPGSRRAQALRRAQQQGLNVSDNLLREIAAL
jgi:(2R)-3-sulfolactate dehydrogenase (NADP+)